MVSSFLPRIIDESEIADQCDFELYDIVPIRLLRKKPIVFVTMRIPPSATDEKEGFRNYVPTKAFDKKDDVIYSKGQRKPKPDSETKAPQYYKKDGMFRGIMTAFLDPSILPVNMRDDMCLLAFDHSFKDKTGEEIWIKKFIWDRYLNLESRINSSSLPSRNLYEVVSSYD
jgi:hypothetical protein